jgi:hypothetical protein
LQLLRACQPVLVKELHPWPVYRSGPDSSDEIGRDVLLLSSG